MTLILTMLSRVGIVHVMDSNLSGPPAWPVLEGTKAFQCARLHAGVACGGAYGVNGAPMDQWLPARISEYEASPSPTVVGLAGWLRRCLEAGMTTEEKKRSSFLHVAGYAEDADGWHPEMYIVTNVP